MSTTVTYKGNQITTVDNETKTLNTAGKWLEGNIVVTDVKMYADYLAKITSENLHDSADDIANVYINGSTETSYNGWSATDYIPVESNTLYLIKNYNVSNVYNAYYNDSKNPVKGSVRLGSSYNNGEGYSIFLTPSDASYIRLSATTSNVTSLEIYEIENKIPANSYSISSNGTYDITEYKNVNVNVPLGAGEYTLENISPSQSITTNASVSSYATGGMISSYTERIQEGEWYLVTYDGDEYVLQCYLVNTGEIVLGDVRVATTNTTSTYLSTPFIVEYNSTVPVYFLAARNTNTHTLKIDKFVWIEGGATVGTKTISSNGTYDPSDDSLDYYSGVTVSIPSGSPSLQAKTNIAPTTSSQTITADSGYDGLSSVQINAMPSGTEGTPTATKGSVSNHAVSVTPSVTNVAGYISGGTHSGTAVSVSASELVSGTYNVSSSGTKDVTNYASASVPSLTLPTSASASATSGYTSKAMISRSTSDQYINIPTGFNDAGGYYKISAVANGSASTPATSITANPSISVSSSGLITATASASQSVTPTVSAGYVSSGTAGTVTVSGSNTSQLTTLGATTYNTSSTDQTITSGKYITGTQTIKAVTVSGLDASKILSGTTVKIGDANDDDRIASVSGSVTFSTIYTGSSAPSNGTGVNGDIYIKTS